MNQLEKDLKQIKEFDYTIIKIRKKPVKLIIDCINHCMEQGFDLMSLLKAMGRKNYFIFRKGESEWLYNFPNNLTYPYKAHKCLEYLISKKVPVKDFVFIYMNSYLRTLLPLNHFIESLYKNYKINSSTDDLRKLFLFFYRNC